MVANWLGVITPEIARASNAQSECDSYRFRHLQVCPALFRKLTVKCTVLN